MADHPFGYNTLPPEARRPYSQASPDPVRDCTNNLVYRYRWNDHPELKDKRCKMLRHVRGSNECTVQFFESGEKRVFLRSAFAQVVGETWSD